MYQLQSGSHTKKIHTFDFSVFILAVHFLISRSTALKKRRWSATLNIEQNCGSPKLRDLPLGEPNVFAFNPWTSI